MPPEGTYEVDRVGRADSSHGDRNGWGVFLTGSSHLVADYYGLLAKRRAREHARRLNAPAEGD